VSRWLARVAPRWWRRVDGVVVEEQPTVTELAARDTRGNRLVRADKIILFLRSKNKKKISVLPMFTLTTL
jgi:hypothetical protein